MMPVKRSGYINRSQALASLTRPPRGRLKDVKESGYLCSDYWTREEWQVIDTAATQWTPHVQNCYEELKEAYGPKANASQTTYAVAVALDKYGVRIGEYYHDKSGETDLARYPRDGTGWCAERKLLRTTVSYQAHTWLFYTTRSPCYWCMSEMFQHFDNSREVLAQLRPGVPLNAPVFYHRLIVAFESQYQPVRDPLPGEERGVRSAREGMPDQVLSMYFESDDDPQLEFYHVRCPTQFVSRAMQDSELPPKSVLTLERLTPVISPEAGFQARLLN
jgi:hypothetical protein